MDSLTVCTAANGRWRMLKWLKNSWAGGSLFHEHEWLKNSWAGGSLFGWHSQVDADPAKSCQNPAPYRSGDSESVLPWGSPPFLFPTYVDNSITNWRQKYKVPIWHHGDKINSRHYPEKSFPKVLQTVVSYKRLCKLITINKRNGRWKQCNWMKGTAWFIQ